MKLLSSNNKRGQVVIYGLMIALVVAILALRLAPAVLDFTTDAMAEPSGDTYGLNCSSDSLSNYDKATCVVVDLNLFYFIGGLLFMAGAIATARIYLR